MLLGLALDAPLPALDQAYLTELQLASRGARPSRSPPGLNELSSLCRKDESKEPIVEVRTEEERTPNHDGGKHTEPNETTPLTEPEYVLGRGCYLRSRAPHPPDLPAYTSHAPHPQLLARHCRPEFWSLWPEMPWLRNA